MNKQEAMDRAKVKSLETGEAQYVYQDDDRGEIFAVANWWSAEQYFPGQVAIATFEAGEEYSNG